MGELLMGWLLITAVVIVLLNLGLGTFLLVIWLTERYRRKLRLRRLPKGRVIDLTSRRDLP